MPHTISSRLKKRDFWGIKKGWKKQFWECLRNVTMIMELEYDTGIQVEI